LQRPGVTPDDRFEDLGGDSLSAVRVLVAVNERLGCDLPPDYIQRHPVLRDLAHWVDRIAGGGIRPETSVVFQREGEGCPFFFVAGIGGSVLGYRRVASGLAARHPAYGLALPSTDLAGAAVSVESIAARYAAEIRTIVPRGGRAIVVGHSFAGVVAFEVSRQLRKNGHWDPLPVVIDMPALNAPGTYRRSTARLVLDMVCNLPAWAAHEALHFQGRKFLARARGNLDRLRRSFRGLAAPAELDPRIYFGQEKLPDAYQAFLNVMYRAMLAYVPARYEGEVIVLRTRIPTLWRTTDLQMGWQNVAAGVEVRQIPGSHGDCLSEEHGEELTRVLRQCAVHFEAEARPLDVSLL